MQTMHQELTHSFVVKLWVEEVDPTTDRSSWRGHITHVLSGEREYFQSIQKMNHFILPYINKWDETDQDELVEESL